MHPRRKQGLPGRCGPFVSRKPCGRVLRRKGSGSPRGLRGRGALRCGRGCCQAPPGPVVRDELLEFPPRLVVRQLDGRVLHEVGRGGEHRTGKPHVPSEPAEPDRVDSHPGAVRRVGHRQTQLDLDRQPPEPLPLDPQEAELVVLLPGDVVRRPDVDVLVRDIVREHATSRPPSSRSSSTGAAAGTAC